MAAMKIRELITILENEGFARITSGKHLKYAHPDGRWTCVSKGNKEINWKTLKKIEKQTGLKLR